MIATDKKIATLVEIRRAIQDVFTSEFNSQLFKHCIIRLNSVFKIKYNVDKGFRGIMIEDFISETVESFLKTDGRNWYPEKFPDFRKQFISALDSVISNTLKSDEEKIKNTFEILDNDTEFSFDDSDYKEILNLCTNELILLGATDDELLLFEPYIINGMKRQDLADLYGISLEDLTNIKKRIDRKLPIIKEKLKLINYEK
jgi:hypothetical protein